MTDCPAIEAGTVVDLDALVALAAARRSGLRTQRADVGVCVTARAARWAARVVCHPPIFSVVDMLAVHVRRRAVRTDFVADSPTSKRNVCLAWRSSNGGRDLALVIAFEDELARVLPCSDTSLGDLRGRR